MNGEKAGKVSTRCQHYHEMIGMAIMTLGETNEFISVNMAKLEVIMKTSKEA
jgi:hypothetical protein